MTPTGARFDSALADSYSVVDQLATKAGPDRPWDASIAPELDSMTVATWVEQNISDPLLRRMHLTLLTIVIGADPSEVSMLYWATDAAKCENIHALQVIANHSLWMGGAGGISQRIAAALGSNVRLGEPVIGIEQRQDWVAVSTRTTTLCAKRVVLAMPPGSADQIHFTPALPLPRRQLQGRATLGRYAKVQLRYEGCPWLDGGWSGEVFDLDRGTTTLDVTRPGDELSTLVTFVGASFCDKWAAGEPGKREKT